MAIRLRLDLSYDGTDFAGWARQPSQRTVQGVLEDALATVLRLDEARRITAAGRTDAGVHARGQVAHVDVPEDLYRAAEPRLAYRLSRVVPRDIRLRRACPAPDGFDARFSAVSRRYVYRICDDTLGVDPLRRRFVLWHPRPLDVARMREAAGRLLGEHDFAAFCRPREGATTIRRLLRFDWERVEELGERLIVATVEADAFCHSMVRALVGACLAVGEGRRGAEWPRDVLSRRARDPAATVVAPHGLCLEQVRYPPDDELATRATQARKVRFQA